MSSSELNSEVEMRGSDNQISTRVVSLKATWKKIAIHNGVTHIMVHGQSAW